MSKRNTGFSLLPIWLKVSILVTETFFVLILGTVVVYHFAELQRIEREKGGAEHALSLADSLSDLSRYSAECTLFSINQPEAEAHLQSCEEAKSEFEQRASARGPDYLHLPDETISSINHRDTTHFSSYSLKITGTEEHIRAVLDDYFKVYTGTGVQLSSLSEVYTTGRLVLVHLPELYAYLIMTRDEAVHAQGLDASYSHLLQTQGAVYRIVEQAENTMRVLVQTVANKEIEKISTQLIDLHSQITDYFEFLEQTKLAATGQSSYQRNIEQMSIVGELLDDVKSLNISLSERFLFYLDQQYAETQQRLILVFGMTLALQALLLVLYGAIARTFADAKSSASKLAANLAKQDKMFSIIGHELRTPASALKMQIDELVTQGSREPRLKELSHTAEHLLDVLDDMRVGSSTSISDEFKVEAEFSVYQLCEEVVHSLYFLASRYKVNLHFNASNYANISSYGRKKQIRQIVINLVKNAILHSEGSRVELRLQTEEQTDKTSFSVQVLDNGAGIKDSLKASLFEAFERGESKSSGTGLGLYVSRQLAKEMEGGDLTLRDNPTGGSIFELRFTLYNFDPELEEDSTAVSLIQGKRILFVEDTPTLLMLGHAILARSGAEVIDASHGKDALARFEDGDYDLVITDIMMPEMDGYELTRQLRERGFAKPIIGVTGATVGSEADRLLDSGADSVLPKPLTLENLNAALRAIDDSGKSE